MYSVRVTRHHSCRVSPFGHPRITRSVDSSPRLIAASYVLHRLPVPRHPPCALKHLQHKIPIIEIAHQQNNNHTPTTTPTPERTEHDHGRHGYCSLDARNHYPQIKHHTPPPRWSDNTPHPKRSNTTAGSPQTGEEVTGLLPQSPIVCLDVPPPAPQRGRPTRQVCCAPEPETHYRPGPSNESLRSPIPPRLWAAHQSRGAP